MPLTKPRSVSDRRVLGVVFALVLALAGTMQAAERIKLAFATPLATWAEVEAARDQFQVEFPNIEVELVPISGDLGEGILRFAAAGQLADVFSIYHDILPGLLAHNLLTPLEPFFAGDQTTKTSDYVGLDMGRPGIYALPLTVNTWFTVFNRTLFRSIGLADPAANWTTEDFRDMAVKLTRDTSGEGEIDQWGFAGHYALRVVNSAESRLFLFGAALFGKNGRPTVDTEPMVEALTFWSDLVARGMDQIPGLNSNEHWKAGKVGMGIQDRVWLASMAQTLSFEWGLTPLPFKRAVPRATVGTGHYFAIGRASPNKQAAWEFIKWLTGLKGHRVLAPRGLLPGHRGAFPIFQEFWRTSPPNWNPPRNIQVVTDATAYSRPPSIVGTDYSGTDVQPLVVGLMENAVLRREISPRQGAADMQRRLEAMLTKK